MGRLELGGVCGALRALAAALSLAAGLACAQQDAATRLDSDPPLPPPTEAQLERGRELLGKIVHVMRNVPLQDSAAVLGVFGFTDLKTLVYPTNTRVAPRTKMQRSSIAPEYLGSGFVNIETPPLVRDPKWGVVAKLSGRLNRWEACISIDDVERQFATVAERQVRPNLVIDRFSSPRRAHDIGHISFRPVGTATGQIGVISFLFDYQVCTTTFSFTYWKADLEEVSQ